MSQSYEQAKSRLDNISTIEPLLGALRTMSMGTWQMALNKIDQIDSFEKKTKQILEEITPAVKKTRKIIFLQRKTLQEEESNDIFLLIGTERGLCGKFNELLIEESLKWIENLGSNSFQIWAMGTRLIQKMNQKNIDISWRSPMQSSGLPDYQEIHELIQNWLDQYENFSFKNFYILSNQARTGGKYIFTNFRLLPYQENLKINENQDTLRKYPQAIIETNPQNIYLRIIQHTIASSFYKILLKSLAAEHSARFNLMEEAKNNAEEIIEDLRRVINSERKKQITQEMQELAVGSGLLDNR